MESEITQCPVCGFSEFSLFLESKDYFLTGEDFSIIQCTHCGLLATRPAPGPGVIGRYYESKEYLAHDASRVTFMTLLYRGARRIALNGKYNLVRSHTQGKRILDIGCGTGEFLDFCNRRGFEAEGVEPNPRARETAFTRYQLTVREKLDFGAADKNRYDCVTLWHVLEHMHNPAETLEQVREILRPDGTLIIALPNPDSWDARHYARYWGAYDLPRHLFHFRSPTFRQLADKTNFDLIKTFPQKLDSFYVSLLSEKYLRHTLRLPRAFFIGLYSNLKGKKPEFGYSSHVYILKNKKS